MSLSSSPHLRGIVIAGGLALVALALAYVTLGMNQSASSAAPPKTILPLKDRHPASARPAAKASGKAPASKAKATAKPKRKPLDPNLVAALQAGLPHSVAAALAKSPVAIVALTSHEDAVDEMSAQQAQAGAALGGASFVALSVDSNGGGASALTRVLGSLPSAPAVLVYERPSTLYTTLAGFNDSTTVQQAAASALTAYEVAHPKTAGGKVLEAASAARASWAQGATAACTSMDRSFVPVVQQMVLTGNVSQVQTKFETLSEQFLTSMRALKAPAGEAAEVARLNTLMQQFLGAIDEQMAAIIRKDAPGEAAAHARAKVIAQEENKVAVALGAPECGGWIS